MNTGKTEAIRLRPALRLNTEISVFFFRSDARMLNISWPKILKYTLGQMFMLNYYSDQQRHTHMQILFIYMIHILDITVYSPCIIKHWNKCVYKLRSDAHMLKISWPKIPKIHKFKYTFDQYYYSDQERFKHRRIARTKGFLSNMTPFPKRKFPRKIWKFQIHNSFSIEQIVCLKDWYFDKSFSIELIFYT